MLRYLRFNRTKLPMELKETSLDGLAVVVLENEASQNRR